MTRIIVQCNYCKKLAMSYKYTFKKMRQINMLLAAGITETECPHCLHIVEFNPIIQESTR